VKATASPSLQAEYEKATHHRNPDGDPDQSGIGPIVELGRGPFLLTLNPLFAKQDGRFADQEDLGFEYGLRI
jgi:hypothetical protein